jgi:DNA-directed RNA polymerase subunit N (RpoN/RPB10)
MDLRLAALKAVYFYFLQNVSTMNQCRKLSCGTVVCKHFASYQGYPSLRVKQAMSVLSRPDEYDGLGKTYAAKLRRMPAALRDIADKLINDVLFNGL